MRRRVRLMTKTKTDEVLRLTKLLADHAAAATKRNIRVSTCRCDLCAHASRRLERLRAEG